MTVTKSHYLIKFETLIDKPESKSLSKVQAPNPKRQIQKGKGEFGSIL